MQNAQAEDCRILTYSPDGSCLRTRCYCQDHCSTDSIHTIMRKTSAQPWWLYHSSHVPSSRDTHETDSQLSGHRFPAWISGQRLSARDMITYQMQGVDCRCSAHGSCLFS